MISLKKRNIRLAPAPLRRKTALLYLTLTFAAVAVIMILIGRHSKVPESHVARPFSLEIMAILDPGHGGLDGGAATETGVTEAPITLSICQKTQALMRLFGVSAMLTRSDDNSLDYQPQASARANKNADLKARLAIAQAYPDSEFLSVHLNQFPQRQYYGAQTFYAVKNVEGKVLAEALQARLISFLDPTNTRVAKKIPNQVFLMERITSPAVTIECGFLSNPQEQIKLQAPAYHVQISIAIVAGYFDYIKGSIT